MFTTNNRRNRTAALITIAAASAILSSADFAAPKKDTGRARNHQDVYEVKLVHPATPPSGIGDHDITAAGMRNRNLDLTPEPAGSIVTITTPAPFPTGRGNDITAGAISNREFGRGHNRQDAFEVKLTHPATPPAGIGDHDITASALMATGSGSSRTASAASAASAPSHGFLQSLDMTSSVRYAGKSTVAASARNPFADGRAWASLDRDARNGLVATAGWSFLLK
jgi:hypothetical protein